MFDVWTMNKKFVPYKYFNEEEKQIEHKLIPYTDFGPIMFATIKRSSRAEQTVQSLGVYVNIPAKVRERVGIKTTAIPVPYQHLLIEPSSRKYTAL